MAGTGDVPSLGKPSISSNGRQLLLFAGGEEQFKIDVFENFCPSERPTKESIEGEIDLNKKKG